MNIPADFPLAPQRARGHNPVNIGGAAAASRVSAKMIRHYESIGLIARPSRTGAGYRLYSQHDIQVLQFIHRGRQLGFSLENIRTLLALWDDSCRASKDVRTLAIEHMAVLDRRIAEMQSMRHALEGLTEVCVGDQRPDCPILDDFAQR